MASNPVVTRSRPTTFEQWRSPSAHGQNPTAPGRAAGLADQRSGRPAGEPLDRVRPRTSTRVQRRAAPARISSRPSRPAEAQTPRRALGKGRFSPLHHHLLKRRARGRWRRLSPAVVIRQESSKDLGVECQAVIGAAGFPAAPPVAELEGSWLCEERWRGQVEGADRIPHSRRLHGAIGLAASAVANRLDTQIHQPHSKPARRAAAASPW